MANRQPGEPVIQDNLMAGAILLGDIRGSAEIQAAIKKKQDISRFKGELARADFDFERLGQGQAK